MSALAAAPSTKWPIIPFGRVFARSRDSGRPELEPLSVFLDDGVVPRSSRSDNHNQLGADMATYLVVQPGDIVFNKLRTWQGGLGVSRHDGVVSPAYFVCRPLADVDSRFFHYLLRSHRYLAELTRLSKFMPPSQFDIAWDDLRSMRVPVPGREEQRAIADYLDAETARIDALVTKKRRLIGLLDEAIAIHLDDTVWQHALPLVPLKLLVPPSRKIMYGIVLPGPTVDVGPLIVKGGDIKEGRLDPALLARTTYEIEARYARSRLRRDDLIIAIRGGVGEVEMAPASIEGANITQDVARISPIATVSPTWLLHALRAPSTQRNIERRITGATIRGINIEELGRVRVPVPDLTTQERLLFRLTAQLRRTSTTKKALTSQIALLREHRQALITAAVTGELSVPGAA